MNGFSRQVTIGIIAASAFLLCFLLVFPAHYDQYIFYVGGEKLVRDGAIPFRDLMDTKPALIFYIYGFSTWLFGHSLYAIRWFDLFFHLGVLWYFFTIISRAFHRTDIALLCLPVYVLFYVAGGPFATAQAESFALLPNLVIFDLTCRRATENLPRRRVLIYGIVSGLAGVILFQLKYTLVLSALAALLFVLRSPRDRRQLTYFFSFLGSLLLGCVAWIGYLAINGALPNVIENLRWLGAYAGMFRLDEVGTYKQEILDKFIRLFAQTFSLTFIVLGAAGIFAWFREKSTDERLRSPYAYYLLLQLTVSLLVIVIERKYLYYLFARSFWCIAPFIAYAALTFFKRPTAGHRPLRWLFAMLLLFYSPLTEIIARAAAPLVSIFTSRGDQSLRSAFVDDEIGREYEYAAEAIAPRMASNDQVFIFGHHIGLYFHLDRRPPTFVNDNGFITAPWAPAKWKTQMMEELRKANPRFVIIEFNDALPVLNASGIDSWEHFQQWTELRDWVTAHYVEEMPVNRFRIFARRRNS